ncbi:MAG: ABC transporter ATP-binding protein, partial [Thermodesulfobacteriota bacterium]|nr:ABC transporter ATP-binding protein [Thermodesulfobacteriota bacterium]
TYLFISHDLSVVEHISDRIAVMYLGKIVELADKKSLYKNPLHPYTRALLSAVPVPDPTYKKRREVLGGNIPSPINSPSGCPFHSRCRYSMDICDNVIPAIDDRGNGHYVACHLKAGF